MHWYRPCRVNSPSRVPGAATPAGNTAWIDLPDSGSRNTSSRPSGKSLPAPQTRGCCGVSGEVGSTYLRLGTASTSLACRSAWAGGWGVAGSEQPATERSARIPTSPGTPCRVRIVHPSSFWFMSEAPRPEDGASVRPPGRAGLKHSGFLPLSAAVARQAWEPPPCGDPLRAGSSETGCNALIAERGCPVSKSTFPAGCSIPKNGIGTTNSASVSGPFTKRRFLVRIAPHWSR